MAEIKEVVIKAGKHEFKLSLDEARSLRDILNAAFPDEKIQFIPTPYPYPLPIITPIERHPWGPWITWTAGDNLGNASYSAETLFISSARSE